MGDDSDGPGMAWPVVLTGRGVDVQTDTQLVNVAWSHPAYANKHIYARNDEEIICASLAADGK